MLLTFFLKCFTGGCANRLSSLRDHQADLDAPDMQILTVSVDPSEGEKDK
jgi:peroxiredoxin